MHLFYLKISFLKSIIILVSLFGFQPILTAQLGYSSASLSMSKAISNAGQIPLPSQVIVEEYFNYHKHLLPAPFGSESVALDISNYQTPENDIIVQVGLSTGSVKEVENIPPVNVCLVIDISGSMSGDRIEKAKEASIEFVRRLREKDILSVVLFDDQIDVLIKPQTVTNKPNLIEKIQTIGTRGGTDLNRGIIQGYVEVLKNYEKAHNNKLIVLTDALTNTGIVDPAEIVKNSKNYSIEHEIDITMVGVGIDFNNDLSRQISQSNNSSIFYINDAADIEKVFIDEIESLLSPIGSNARLEIQLPSHLEIEKCFGYQPTIIGNTVRFNLEKMNSGLTQVFLFKVKLKEGHLTEDMITAKLDYFDIQQKEKRSVHATGSALNNRAEKKRDVKKNYAIARLAQCIKDVSTLNEEKNYSEAIYRSKYILKTTTDFYPNLKDKDIKRVYDLLNKYNKTLSQEISNDQATQAFPY